MALFLERRFSLNGHPFGVREVAAHLFAYSGFLGIIIQGGLLGRIVKRFGERKILFTGFFCMGAGYGLLSLIHTIPIFARRDDSIQLRVGCRSPGNYQSHHANGRPAPTGCHTRPQSIIEFSCADHRAFDHG